MSPVPYDQFRTGLTYADVYHMIYGRKWKRRRGVLGYWRQLKLAMYAEYVEHCRSGKCWQPSKIPIPE